MNGRQKLIDDVYGGDVRRYEYDCQEGLLYAVSWNDLKAATTILPDLETKARELIEQRLGYLPHDSALLRYEPFLRGLIQAKHQGQLSESNFMLQVDEHIKLIRNEDMKHNLCLTYEPEIYESYHNCFVPYGYAVRNRLIRFLGYEPKLAHSVAAELWLREVIARDTINLPDYMTAVDYKVITLIKYREVLLQQGKMSADSSPLIRQ